METTQQFLKWEKVSATETTREAEVGVLGRWRIAYIRSSSIDGKGMIKKLSIKLPGVVTTKQKDTSTSVPYLKERADSLVAMWLRCAGILDARIAKNSSEEKTQKPKERIFS